MPKKGENIYKRKDNRWEARYIKDYTPTGKPKYGYCYAKTYREVKEKVTQAKAARLSNLFPINDTVRRRFSYYCDEWLRLNQVRVKESTYVKYFTNIEKHIKPKLGGYFIHTFSSPLIEEFSRELLYKERLAPKTVKDILILLHAILTYIGRNYPGAMPIVEIVYPKEIKKEMRVLTKEEQSAFMEYLMLDMDEGKFGVMLALLTGMRLGEICALRWEDVSLEERTIKICSTMQRLKDLNEEHHGKTKIVISDPKSRTSTRIIPLTGCAAKLCKKRNVQNPAAFVLTGEENRYMEPRTLQYRLKRYTRECNLEGVHFHTLRHSFATRCIEVDFEIKSLSEILGHASPQITLERYVHSSLALKRSNMDKLETIGY